MLNRIIREEARRIMQDDSLELEVVAIDDPDTVVVAKYNGYKETGFSRCHWRDRFNASRGIEIAQHRAVLKIAEQLVSERKELYTVAMHAVVSAMSHEHAARRTADEFARGAWTLGVAGDNRAVIVRKEPGRSMDVRELPDEPSDPCFILVNIAKWIEELSAQSKDSEYTDTGEAWDLLRRIWEAARGTEV